MRNSLLPLLDKQSQSAKPKIQLSLQFYVVKAPPCSCSVCVSVPFFFYSKCPKHAKTVLFIETKSMQEKKNNFCENSKL